MFAMRGDGGGPNDNNAAIAEILKLRRERANLLGYPTHAHWRLENAMAGTPEKALELMESVWAAGHRPGARRGRRHAGARQRRRLGPSPSSRGTTASTPRRCARPATTSTRTRSSPTSSSSCCATACSGWPASSSASSSSRSTDVPVAHPDIRVWKVSDKTTGKLIGLWFFDPYARAGKRSGAWMNAYRRQQRFEGEITTIVSNNANFVQGKPGEPLLISWRDATTLFHEFGHALHGLSSNVTYASLSGTAVARDYVEFPSQLMEHFLATPEVLQKFALHYQTGERIPQNLVDRIERAATFSEGFRTVEYLSGALYDMKIHLADPATIDPPAFEKQFSADFAPAQGNRAAPPADPVPARLLGRRLLRRLLQLPVVGRPDRRRLAGLPGRQRRLRQRGGGAAGEKRVLGGQHDRPGSRLPRLPRPRPDHLAADEKARLPALG